MRNKLPHISNEIHMSRLIEQVIELRLQVNELLIDNQNLTALIHTYAHEMLRWMTKNELAEVVK